MEYETNIFDFEINNEPSIQKLDNMDDKFLSKKEDNLLSLMNLKKEKWIKFIKHLPTENEIYRILSNGTYDLFTFIDYIIKDSGFVINELYISTWATTTIQIKLLLKYFDEGKIKELNMVLGDYHKFKSRPEYGLLVTELNRRKQRFCIFNNHVKLILLTINNNYYVLESSANLTSNPRLELHILSNNKLLYDFHKSWMLEMLCKTI